MSFIKGLSEGIRGEPRSSASPSAQLIQTLVGVAAFSLATVAVRAARAWPAEGDFLWGVGYSLGYVTSDASGMFFAVVGLTALAAAVVLQLLRVVFRLLPR